MCVLALYVNSSSKLELLTLDQLRQLEIEMNQAFDQYRELYYDGGVCSVYLWETGKENTSSFAGSILFKKAGDGSQKIKGCWDSIHIFEVISTTRTSYILDGCEYYIIEIGMSHRIPNSIALSLTI